MKVRVWATFLLLGSIVVFLVAMQAVAFSSPGKPFASEYGIGGSGGGGGSGDQYGLAGATGASGNQYTPSTGQTAPSIPITPAASSQPAAAADTYSAAASVYDPGNASLPNTGAEIAIPAAGLALAGFGGYLFRKRKALR